VPGWGGRGQGSVAELRWLVSATVLPRRTASTVERSVLLGGWDEVS
jgi:hypothetical protein